MKGNFFNLNKNKTKIGKLLIGVKDQEITDRDGSSDECVTTIIFNIRRVEEILSIKEYSSVGRVRKTIKKSYQLLTRQNVVVCL